MNLWTLGMLYIVLNTLITASNIIHNQTEINSGFKMIYGINKPLAWISVVLVIVLSIFIASPVATVQFIYYFIKGSFK